MLGDESSVGYKYKFLQGKIKRRYGELNFETFVRWVLRDLKKALDPTNGIGEVLDPHWRPCFNK